MSGKFKIPNPKQIPNLQILNHGVAGGLAPSGGNQAVAHPPEATEWFSRALWFARRGVTHQKQNGLDRSSPGLNLSPKTAALRAFIGNLNRPSLIEASVKVEQA